MLRLAVAAFVSLIANQILAAKVIDQSATIAGMSVYYKVVLPKDYDSANTYPAVLAFPPGSQTNDMVMTTLTQNWAAQAQRRGYLVIIPAAPEGRLFIEDGARIFPQFLDRLLTEYKIRDKKFFIAGMSNGGLSAFHIAASFPQYFVSIIGFPGYLPDATKERVEAIAKMCIYMHVGELDSGWRGAMEQQASEFRSKGMKVQMTVEKGESHVIRALTGDGAARLFEEIEDASHGCSH